MIIISKGQTPPTGCQWVVHVGADGLINKTAADKSIYWGRHIDVGQPCWCPPSHTLTHELAVYDEKRNFSAHQWLHFEQKKPFLIHWRPQRERIVAAWLRLDFGWWRRPSQSIRCRDERARRHSRVLWGTRADRRSPLNLWQLLSRGRMMAGRKEVEQRRPSEIKGARIKGLSLFFP